MNETDLIELAGNPAFISGIYNYCDRWCERCPFTSRCFLYATEKADEELDDPEVHDVNNAKFWRKLESIFTQTHKLMAKWAEEAGLDLTSVDVQSEIAAHDLETTDAEQHELSVSARHYAEMVQRWFEEEYAVDQIVYDDTTVEAKSSEEDLDLSDAVEVIRWYQFFIAAKTFRALIGVEDEPEDFASDSEITLDAAQRDSDGSAKIALIAIDRSMSAWRVMQNSLTERADSIIPMLVELERLKRSTERTFPNARDFIRPGFDEVVSEFAS